MNATTTSASSPAPTSPAPTKGSGLAITALALGVPALLLSPLPIINNFAFPIALVGAGFAIPALISAAKGKRSGKGLAIAGTVLNILALVIVLGSQALYASAIDDIGKAAAGKTDSSGVISSSDNEKFPPQADAAITSCGRVYGSPSAKVAVTNHSPAVSSYMVNVEFLDATGTRISEGTALINDVASGQTASDAAGAVEETSGKFTCKVLRVERYASTS